MIEQIINQRFGELNANLKIIIALMEKHIDNKEEAEISDIAEDIDGSESGDID